jgi:hypothetical protein
MNIVVDFGAVLFTWQPAQLVTATFLEIALTPEAAKRLAHAILAMTIGMDLIAALWR